MPDCELLEGCLFFNDRMQSMPTVVELLKERLCRGEYTECARYMVYRKLGRPRVPPDLFPSDRDRAWRILKEAAGAAG